MTFATLYSYIGTYLAVRKALVATEQKIADAKAYDKPCCDLEKSQKKGLFLLWCLENIDCYEDTTDKLISVANRWSRNCANCTVTQTEIDAFLLTEKGDELAYISGLSGYITNENGTWLLQENGYQIIL
jgi:hypothetical protein